MRGFFLSTLHLFIFLSSTFIAVLLLMLSYFSDHIFVIVDSFPFSFFILLNINQSSIFCDRYVLHLVLLFGQDTPEKRVLILVMFLVK